MSINNNHNMLSTTNYKTSATTTANTTISNNTTGGTNTTSSCPSSPLAAAMVQQQKQQQQALKCPRCDSSNTKFCYYNNYSLSQPRHFCKACKRYWTRGGTLRNVPVGGGCRKNKRVKKAPATATTCSAAVTASNPKNSSLLSPLPHPSATTTTTSDHLNSLFFDLLPNSAAAVASSMNLASTTSPFPTLPQMYDLQPQMSALGVRFSPQKFQLGFASSSLADLQQSGSSLLNSYQPPYDQELRVETNGIFELPKQVKEEGKNNVNGSDDGVGIEWQDQDPYYNMTQFDVAAANIAAAGVSSGDSSYLYWSSAILGGGAGWPDIVNSSIAPLI